MTEAVGVITNCAGSRSPGAALGPVHNGTATAFGGPQVLAECAVIISVGCSMLGACLHRFYCLVQPSRWAAPRKRNRS
jgi:hypothetical protein